MTAPFAKPTQPLPAETGALTPVSASTGTLGPGTLAARASRPFDPSFGSLVAPLHQTTTFAQTGEIGGQGESGFTYTRAANPTIEALERALAALEDGRPNGSAEAVCQRSGMAAITTLFLATVESGDHVAIARTVYGGTVRLAREVLEPLGVSATFFVPSDEVSVAAALAKRPRLVFLESPGNPTLELVDVRRLAARAKAETGALVAVDNTFQTPLGLRPLDLGADVSVYSTTKFLEGHGTTLGGALVTRASDAAERFRRITKSTGCTQAPLDAWLTLRGLSTLPLRFEQQCENALKIATWLDEREGVRSVRYPGLPSFPGAAVAKEQHLFGRRIQLHGAIVSFELDAADIETTQRFLKALQLVVPAEHLGTTETLATHPATMTHGDVPRAQRDAAGITDGLVRLSAGLEDAEDIVRDLSQAIDVAFGAVPSAARSPKGEEVQAS